MNFNKCTQKSMEALQSAQQLASQNANSQIEQVHLMQALFSQENGLIPELLKSVGVQFDFMQNGLNEILNKLPRVSGNSDIYISRDLDRALTEAENAASKMNDEYTSVEHLMLGLLRKADKNMKALFDSTGLSESNFLAALKNVRGNRSVTDQNPEDTYDVL